GESAIAIHVGIAIRIRIRMAGRAVHGGDYHHTTATRQPRGDEGKSRIPRTPPNPAPHSGTLPGGHPPHRGANAVIDESRRFTDREVALILRRAAEIDEREGHDASGSLSWGDLRGIAAEVGISPDAVDRAVRS